jgi:hypothetical protein
VEPENTRNWKLTTWLGWCHHEKAGNWRLMLSTEEVKNAIMGNVHDKHSTTTSRDGLQGTFISTRNEEQTWVT